ncbi:hypothetical protein [Ascidiimonas sp. W6]|uniref:hypothetical protein n=1 Tax=Ascidiimonas meishanensis TaxID=3128903 RepID=UPI0030EC80E8
MRYILILLFATSFIGCKAVKAQNTKDTTPSKPVYRGEDIGIAPGQIKFKAKVISINSEPETDCGNSFSKTVELEIIQIYLTGAATRNIPNLNSIYTFQLNTSAKLPKPNTIIDAMAREMVCKDATMSYFVLDDFIVLE